MTEPMPEWAQKIRHMRLSMQLTGAAFAAQINTSKMTISRWERGISKPSALMWLRLAKFAGPQDCWYFYERAGLTQGDISEPSLGMPVLQDETSMAKLVGKLDRCVALLSGLATSDSAKLGEVLFLLSDATNILLGLHGQNDTHEPMQTAS